MASVCRRMTMRKDRVYLFLRHASPKDPIYTSLVEERLVPKIEFGIGFELLPLLRGHVAWELFCSQKIHQVCVPW